VVTAVDRVRAAKAIQWGLLLLAAASILYGIFGSWYIGPEGVAVSVAFLPIVAGLLILGLGRAIRRSAEREPPTSNQS
jgi:hypothetical protein